MATESLSAESLEAHFPRVRVLMLEEYPDVDGAALDELSSDPDGLVQLVADATDRTKARIKKQLAELIEIAAGDAKKENGAAANGAGDASGETGLTEKLGAQLGEALGRLEARSEELATYAKDELLPKAESRAKDNLLTTILVALGFGFLLGLMVRGAGRR